MENPSTVIQFIASICTATFSAATAFSPQFAIILSNIVEMKANIQDLKHTKTQHVNICKQQTQQSINDGMYPQHVNH